MHLQALLLVLLCGYGVTGQKISTEDRVTQLENTVNQLTRQLMLQQLYTEEMSRSSGDSGLKQIRLRRDGSKPYFTETHTSRSVASFHDHSDHIRTAGMGEIIAVLNGLEFRTRHNDYQLKMPSRTSSEYHATEDIPYPDVPPSVLQRTSIQGQIEEMREWFKAWQAGDPSVRDYRKYFKPNLCYLEGAWTNDVKLDEPFASDRHQLEAESWFELQDGVSADWQTIPATLHRSGPSREGDSRSMPHSLRTLPMHQRSPEEQIRYTSYTGTKNHKENFAYLPTTIMNITEGRPLFGQWNYRILCHPVEGEVKLTDFKPVDNLAYRLVTDKTFAEYTKTRAARFSLDPSLTDEQFRWSKLDELMYQIPGKDNYRVNLTDSDFGMEKVTVNDETPLNVGRYHRWVKVLQKDAMGEQLVHRGFSDRNLFVAETTQPRVAGMSIPYCEKRWHRKRGLCSTVTKKMSYAIPLEIIFTTPLQSWNPFNIEYKGDMKSELGKTVKDGGKRNGLMTPEKAFNGTNNKAYYLTPAAFFTGGEVSRDKADTSRRNVGVLDKNGTPQAVRSSGIRIFLPNIPGVGVCRQRYPIMPVVNEGDPTWKELEALRDVVMDVRQHMRYFENPPTASGSVPEKPAAHITLYTSPSFGFSDGLHTHSIELSRAQFRRLTRNNKTVTLDTSEDAGHVHTVMVDFIEESKEFRIIKCDQRTTCFDGHSPVLQTSMVS